MKLGISSEDLQDLILIRHLSLQVNAWVEVNPKLGEVRLLLKTNFGEQTSLVLCFFPPFMYCCFHPDFWYGPQFFLNWGSAHPVWAYFTDNHYNVLEFNNRKWYKCNPALPWLLYSRALRVNITAMCVMMIIYEICREKNFTIILWMLKHYFSSSKTNHNESDKSDWGVIT